MIHWITRQTLPEYFNFLTFFVSHSLHPLSPLMRTHLTACRHHKRSFDVKIRPPLFSTGWWTWHHNMHNNGTTTTTCNNVFFIPSFTRSLITTCCFTPCVPCPARFSGCWGQKIKRIWTGRLMNCVIDFRNGLVIWIDWKERNHHPHPASRYHGVKGMHCQISCRPQRQSNFNPEKLGRPANEKGRGRTQKRYLLMMSCVRWWCKAWMRK
jgi:hypothetical protein